MKERCRLKELKHARKEAALRQIPLRNHPHGEASSTERSASSTHDYYNMSSITRQLQISTATRRNATAKHDAGVAFCATSAVPAHSFWPTLLQLHHGRSVILAGAEISIVVPLTLAPAFSIRRGVMETILRETTKKEISARTYNHNYWLQQTTKMRTFPMFRSPLSFRFPRQERSISTV